MADVIDLGVCSWEGTMAAKPERRAGDDDLPHELWEEILNRLPVKSILRFRSVCKLWYSLVSCPNFISRYSIKNLNKNGNRILLQVCNKRTNVRSYCSHDKSYMESREHDDFPKPFRGQNLKIVGSCNGLIFLSKIDCPRFKDNAIDGVTTTTLLIWNPTIKKVVEVPSRTFHHKIERLCKLGFGFDSKTSDYKVLCMSCYRKYDAFSPLLPNVFRIFDLRKGVWRTINPLIPSWNFLCDSSPGCYLDGAIHWIGHKLKDFSFYRILLSFNMSDERFREIRLPDFLGFIYEDSIWIGTRCATFNGLIHLIVMKYGDEDRGLYTRGDGSIWIMKEYGVTESWTKLFDIDMQGTRLLPRIEPDQICLWSNEEILIVHGQDFSPPDDEGGELLSYDCLSRKCNRVFPVISKQIKDMCVFEESLVLM